MSAHRQIRLMVGMVVLWAAPLVAQSGGIALPPIVVAERRPGPQMLTTASVARLTADEIGGMPHTTILDLLRLMPGFSQVDGDGSGTAGQVRVRGFYGGGEAEYVVVLVDGRPVNHPATGLVAWEALPPVASIAAIEVLRGGSSALYGDAAIGGVINIITTRQPGGSLTLDGGDPTVRGGSLSMVARGWRAPHLAASVTDRAGGRSHAGRTTMSLDAGVGLLPLRSDGLSATLNLAGTRRDFEEPGPLPASRQDADFRGSDPLYRFDRTRDDTQRGWMDLTWSQAGEASITATLGAGWRASDATRTLVLMPGLGDTKRRRFESRTLDARVVWDGAGVGLPGFRLGSELTNATYASRYAGVVGGPRAVYEGAIPADDPLTRLDGRRSTTALFAQHVWQPTTQVRLTTDLRYDRVGGSASGATTPTHSAWSPRLGLAVGTGERGAVYATVGRSFKAATMDQLHDDRPITGLPVTLSNPALVPQTGTTFELGLRRDLLVGGQPGGHAARVSLNASVYRMAMREEIDFDIATFRYVNIGRSNHDGLEAGMAIYATRGWSVFGNLTLQRAIARAGADSGKDLKAVPRRGLDAGIRWSPGLRGQAMLVVSSVGASWLDGENTQRIPGHTVIDLQGSVALRGQRLVGSLGIRNLFDRQFNSSGFPDAAGTGEVYWYPAAGRSLHLTLTTRW